MPLRMLIPMLLLCALAGLVRAADPVMTEWRDAKGATFKGEPIEAMGPLALFRTGATSSRFVPMTALSAEDCVRFYRTIAARPPRAAKWNEAKGRATAEFIGRLLRSEKGALKPVDLAVQPEPELLLVFFGSRKSEGLSHLLDNFAPFAKRIERVYPGRIATVLMSTWDGAFNHQWLPSARAWFMADPMKQADMKVLSRFVPGSGFVVMLMTREGVPLIGGSVNDDFEVMKFVDQTSAILWELNPENPRTWRDRLHYQRAVRPVQFAAASSPAVAIADPFRADALRARGVKRIAAQLEVDAEGRVTAVTWKEGADFPPVLAKPLAEALSRSGVVLPAIDQGWPASGVCDYVFVVPPALDKKAAADAAWVNGEARVDVPLASWLALKPIRVGEQAFSVVLGVDENGVTRMSAVTAGGDPNKVSTRTQLNAFNTDWFADKGPGSVRPTEGERLEIDGSKVTWKRMKPRDGLVDFLGSGDYNSLNYCVGYAWTEVEVAADTDAWLGIGSDDGLKVWVNGELAIDQWIERTSKLDEEVVPLRLKAGKNAFLVKIQNAKGRWSFTARLRTRGK
ncbi:MAG: hypothetical protein HZA93_23550 [Verrucomicrobia bacterium]|nr:hypothetical protein [Verrucomicrobiota bacterium]